MLELNSEQKEYTTTTLLNNENTKFELKTVSMFYQVLIILLNYFLSCTYIVFPLFLFFLLFVRICNIAETYITS